MRSFARLVAPLRVVRARGYATNPSQPRITTHYKTFDRSADPRWEGVDMERFAPLEIPTRLREAFESLRAAPQGDLPE